VYRQKTRVLNKMVYPSKSANDQALTMKRMCDAWYSVKGSKQKWIGTQFAAVSLIGYTKPKTFLQKTWGKAVENESSISRTLALFCCLPAEMKIIRITTKFEKSYSYSISILYSAHYIMKSKLLIFLRKNAPLVKRSRAFWDEFAIEISFFCMNRF